LAVLYHTDDVQILDATIYFPFKNLALEEQGANHEICQYKQVQFKSFREKLELEIGQFF
jgi:hypothetical protein